MYICLRISGILYVYMYMFQNQWYSVCDHGFNAPEAEVVCRMLGYSNRYVSSDSERSLEPCTEWSRTVESQDLSTPNSQTPIQILKTHGRLNRGSVNCIYCTI